MTTNDGGPAFPMLGNAKHPQGGTVYVQQSGMSLRDWFAGQALMGLMATVEATVAATPAELADAAWTQADAMLAAREASK